MDKTAIILDVDDGNGAGREFEQVVPILDKYRSEDDRINCLAAVDRFADRLKYPPMDSVPKMVRGEKIRYSGVRRVIDQEGPEQRLLGLYAIWRLSRRNNFQRHDIAAGQAVHLCL